MSEYLPPNTQNPIFDPQAWVLRSVPISAADAVSGDVTALTNAAQVAYDTAKTINLALSKYGFTNTIYSTQGGLVCNTPVKVVQLTIAAGSYVISGTIYVNASTIGTSWTSLYMYANIQGVDQQGIYFFNNVAQYGYILSNYVPFTYYCASPSNSQTDIVVKIFAQLNGPTTSGLTYSIGPPIDKDVSICEIIGSNPYLAY